MGILGGHRFMVNYQGILGYVLMVHPLFLKMKSGDNQTFSPNAPWCHRKD